MMAVWRKKPKDSTVPVAEQLIGGNRLLLLGMSLLTLAVLPHLGHIRPEILLIFLFLVGWRLAATRWRWIPTSRWIIYSFALAGFSISAWFYGAPLGRDPGVSFLIVLAGLKCIEVNSKQEIRTMVLLGLFVIITHFLYADGISWALPLIFLVACFSWLMAQLEHVEPKKFMLEDIKMVGKLMLQALPFLVVLFYLFPRLSGSIYLFETRDDSAKSGLSDSVSMGTISNLIKSDDIAFTATFLNQQIPRPEERYWRGSVFWETDGREWTRGDVARYLPDTRLISESPTGYFYDIELQPNDQSWLFSLDYPIAAPASARIDSDHHIYLNRKLESPFRYSLRSSTSVMADDLSDTARLLSLALDTRKNSTRFDQLVASFTDGTGSSLEVVYRVLNYFNKKEFIYTLQPPLLLSESPVEEFLFESRRGFCGHYASSFATIMRAAGIPARLVVGYLGGEFNPLSNQIEVRQSDAHAWTEVWLADRGWTRVDPTIAIAPERVENGIDYENSINSTGKVLFSSRNFAGIQRLWVELGWFKDAVKAKWHRWFVTFDSTRQGRMLESIGLDHLDIRTISMLAFLLAVGILTLVSFLIFRRERIKTDPVNQIYQKFCRKIGTMGVTRRSNEGPRDFARRAGRQLPEFEQQINAITTLFTRLYYASPDQSTADDVSEFRNLVKKMR